MYDVCMYDRVDPVAIKTVFYGGIQNTNYDYSKLTLKPQIYSLRYI